MTRHTRSPNIIQLSAVQTETVERLDAEGRILRGKITLCAGPAGIGKSYATISMAAPITVGLPPLPAIVSPNSRSRAAANVLFISGEDGIGDTIRPRMAQAGADLDRVYVLDGFIQGTNNGPIEMPFDVQQVDILEETLERYQPDLAVLDPVQLYLGHKVDMSSTNEVRRVMSPVAKLASKYKCAFLVVAHFNKGNSNLGALGRVMGSQDFTALARSVLVFGEHEGQKAIGHAKANLTAKAPTLLYAINEHGLLWTGTSDITADDLVATQMDGTGPGEDAKDFLRDLLTDGPQPTNEVNEMAKKAGISHSTLKRAKAALNINSRRIGKPGGGGIWVMELTHAPDGPLDPLAGNDVQDAARQGAAVNLL